MMTERAHRALELVDDRATAAVPPGPPGVGASQEPKYVLGDLLHRGASSVFLAQHRQLDREVVVKRYCDLGIDHGLARQQLAQVAALGHPYTARILDIGASQGAGGGVFVVREFFAGKTLAQCLQSGVRFEGAALMSLATQALKSLGEAHARGLVHGGLCPEHVLVVGEPGEAYIEILDYESTALGLPRGPHAEVYAPPGAAASPATDLRALAMLLRTASTGLPPQWSDRAWPAGDARAHEVLERGIVGEISDAAAFEEALRATCAATAERGADPLLSFGHHELLAEQALRVWVFSDGPGMTSGPLGQVWAELEATAEVRGLDADERLQALEDLRTGRCAPPWLVVFSDLHVLLSDALLECLQQTGEVGRVLVSTHPNYDLLEATVNGCGLDRQVCLPADPRDIVSDVLQTAQIVRRRREHYDELRRRIRLERGRVQAMVRSMAQTGLGV